MLKKLSLLLFVILTVSLFSQSNVTKVYADKGSIHTKDSRSIKARFLQFDDNKLVYYNMNSNVKSEMDMSNVKEIKKYDGDYKVTGAIIGGLAGIAVGIPVAISMEYTETEGIVETTYIPVWPISFGMLTGIVMGYFVGDDIEDYTTIYSDYSVSLDNFYFTQSHHRGTTLNFRLPLN